MKRVLFRATRVAVGVSAEAVWVLFIARMAYRR